MKRFLLLPVAVAFLVLFAAADEGETVPAAEKAQRFHRNRKLVETMVDRGLRLASEEDPVRRAEHCNDIARRLADEIRQAARAHEGYRAQELGGHLRALLHDGVAPILKNAITGVPLSSPGQEELRKIGANVRELTRPVMEQLQAVDDEEDREQLRQTHSAVQEALGEVENTLKGLGKQP
jgi:hypothetical protein